MVTIGFSKPFIANYANDGTKVTYSNGVPLARGVELKTSIEAAEDNNFYADNVVAESESGVFKSGTFEVTVDGLSSTAAKMIYKLPESKEVKVGENTVKIQGYGKSASPQYMGYGCVRETMENGVKQYWPFILPKIKFNVNSDELKTREDAINWQTQKLDGTILRDDTEEENWKYISEEGLATETEAYEVVKAFLGGETTV